MTRTRFLSALGIAGWDALEPAILAALATESPLLLVGPHGSAKTLLLQRLAEALGLAFRHYNASILSFDDLLGYPVPQGGRLVYLETPATIGKPRPCSSTRSRAAAPSCRTSSSP
jgi:MoxR-like ATPase